VTDAAARSRLSAWRYALRTTNPPDGSIDAVTRWIVVSRAAVLPMTLVSGVVAGLLAARVPGADWRWFALAFAGITLAHLANNLMNDLSDTRAGCDTAGYPRALYAPHPLLSGLVTRRALVLAVLAVNAADLGILVVLALARGWAVVAFALAGFLLSVAYTAPPLRLKKRGLGEFVVLVVWGPLMVGGTYYATVGSIPWQVLVASLPYALLCTSVLMGKHIDKIDYDAALGIRTLPVLLGERRARAATLSMMAGYYLLIVLCVLAGALPWPALLALGGLYRLGTIWRWLRQPRPQQPPRPLPVWPLWFAALAFLHVRFAGALLVLGLAVAAVIGL
jgi:1,4-dihydroxy-2-naphthoate octaprenyltransferase